MPWRSRSASATHEIAAMRAALAARERHGIDRIQIRVARVPDGFVAGEETAIIHSLNGGPATPTLTPPRPFERGVGGAPTLVQNVETLAHLWTRCRSACRSPTYSLGPSGRPSRSRRFWLVATSAPGSRRSRRFASG